MSDRVLNNAYGIAGEQEQLLKALDAFDHICRENDIKYALHGGTLLGAERDHHMIPWDDDADVSMLRTEYDKLREIMLRDSSSMDYYLDEKTIWIPHFVMKGTNGLVYIDLLLWDYISEKKAGRVMKLNLLHAVQGMMKEKEYLELERFGLKNKILVMGTYLVGKLFTKKAKQNLYNRIGTKWFLGSRKYIHRYNDSFRGLTYIHDADYMRDYTDIELEGKNYMVNKRYREFLVTEYGSDYMTPPPEKDRKPVHNVMKQRIQKTESGK